MAAMNLLTDLRCPGDSTSNDIYSLDMVLSAPFGARAGSRPSPNDTRPYEVSGHNIRHLLRGISFNLVV